MEGPLSLISEGCRILVPHDGSHWLRCSQERGSPRYYCSRCKKGQSDRDPLVKATICVVGGNYQLGTILCDPCFFDYVDDEP